MRRVLLMLMVVAAASGAAYAGWIWQHQYRLDSLLAQPLPPAVTVRVAPGAPLTAIARAAADSGFPLSQQRFIWLAEQLKVDKKLQAGVYEFQNSTVGEAIAALARGGVTRLRVTFIEGISYRQMREQLIADNRLKSVLATMSDDEVAAFLGLHRDNLEGQFLPDTYFFHEGDTDFSVLERAHIALKNVLTKQWRARTTDFSDNPFIDDAYDALILASIVEKETAKNDERPLIASVFLNRLQKRNRRQKPEPMRLDADPTVIYGLRQRGEWSGNLTRKHLRDKTNPYNTYRNGGLPPTPIALASEASIEAVLNPMASDYYYFVAVGDGSHHFSKTLREHINAVNKYQRRRRQ